MSNSQDNLPPAFGILDFDAEHGLFYIDTSKDHTCRLILIGRTERGYPRRELSVIPGGLWKQIATAVQNELRRGMDPEECGKTAPTFRLGDNALSPLVMRELAVLLWALMEDDDGTHVDALVAGWRQLAREERWWLYARASSPEQRFGEGWRRALFYALSDPADTRTAPRLLDIVEAASGSKKNSGASQNGLHRTQKTTQKSAKSAPKKNQTKTKRKAAKSVKVKKVAKGKKAQPSKSRVKKASPGKRQTKKKVSSPRKRK